MAIAIESKIDRIFFRQKGKLAESVKFYLTVTTDYNIGNIDDSY